MPSRFPWFAPAPQDRLFETQNQLHAARHGLPVCTYLSQPVSSSSRDGIQTGLPPLIGHIPGTGHQFLPLKAVQCGVERTLFNLDQALRCFLHVRCNAETMIWSTVERLQDKQFQTALQIVASLGGHRVKAEDRAQTAACQG